MDSIVQEKVKHFLLRKLFRDHYECGAITAQVTRLAQMAGYDLDQRFADSGLASGPEARVAAAIVAKSIGTGGGGSTSPYEMTNMINTWVRTKPRMGY